MIYLIPLMVTRSKWNNRYKCVKFHRQKNKFLGLSESQGFGQFLRLWDTYEMDRVWKIIDLGGPNYLRKHGLEEGNWFLVLLLWLPGVLIHLFFWRFSGNWDFTGPLWVALVCLALSQLSWTKWASLGATKSSGNESEWLIVASDARWCGSSKYILCIEIEGLRKSAHPLWELSQVIMKFGNESSLQIPDEDTYVRRPWCFMEDIAEAGLICSIDVTFWLILLCLVSSVPVHSSHSRKSYLSKSACALFPA